MSDDTPKPKSRGLGRGLNALFEDEEEDLVSPIASYNEADESAVGSVDGGTGAGAKGKTMLGIDQLVAGRGQPRRIFKEEPLEELADSIKQHGILQPLLVRAREAGGNEYEIIAGERRWRAAQIAQLHEVPVVVLEVSDEKAFEIALIENLQREDLDPIDEAIGFDRLMKEYEYSQAQLAESLGKSRSYIANITRLLQLPSVVQGYLSAGELSIGHARALITAENAADLAEDVMRGGLSVRETERLIAAQRRPEGGGESETKKAGRKSIWDGGAAQAKDPDIVAVENELTSALGMKVVIDSKDGKSGTVAIDFSSLDQMDDLMKRLLSTPDGGGFSTGSGRLRD